MREIDQCTYEHEGFHISFDGEYGHWTATDPDGEFLANITGGLEEALIYLESCDQAEWEAQEPEIDDSIDHHFEELDLLPE